MKTSRGPYFWASSIDLRYVGRVQWKKKNRGSSSISSQTPKKNRFHSLTHRYPALITVSSKRINLTGLPSSRKTMPSLTSVFFRPGPNFSSVNLLVLTDPNTYNKHRDRMMYSIHMVMSNTQNRYVNDCGQLLYTTDPGLR